MSSSIFLIFSGIPTFDRSPRILEPRRIFYNLNVQMLLPPRKASLDVRTLPRWTDDRVRKEDRVRPEGDDNYGKEMRKVRVHTARQRRRRLVCRGPVSPAEIGQLRSGRSIIPSS